MVKKRKLLFCSSLILIVIMFSGSMLTRIHATETMTNNVPQVVQSDKSEWFWPAVEVLTQTTDDSFGEDIFIDDDNNVHFVFNDDTNDLDDSGTDRDIFYMRWDFETKIWSDPETVSTESTGSSERPAIAVDNNGNVHVAWRDYSDILSSGTDIDVFYKRKTSSGSWTSSELVSTASTVNIQDVSIAVDSQGNPTIAWADATDYAGAGGDYDILYNTLTISTSTWLGMTLVSSESGGNSYAPDVFVDESGDIHFTWYDYTGYAGCGPDTDIFYKKFLISEIDWSDLAILSSESDGDSEHPSICIDNRGLIHVTWADDTNYTGVGVDPDIFYKYYDPQLSSWSMTEVISIESTSAALYTTIAVDKEGTVHVTWEDNTHYPGSGQFDYDIIYKYRNTPSDDWSALAIVSNEMTGGSYLPVIAVDGLGHIHIVWYDITNYNGAGFDYDVFYRKFVGPPEDTTLYPISPNSSLPGNITINWEESFGAENYNIYRDQSYILSTSSLTPIASVTTNTFVDDLNASGTFYYSVIAGNYISDSGLSNIESVEILSPEVQNGFFGDFNWGEIVVIAGIVGAIQIILTVSMVVLLKPGSKPTKKKK